MSMQVVLALVIGYVVIVVLVLALLRAAKQGDEAAERGRRALVRQKRARARRRFASDEDREREREREREIVASRRRDD